MGVHSGPINEVTDVNERVNVTGAGINMAQRVMDCGDTGHILLSKRVADDLAQYRHWQPLLHELGECVVKHGVRLDIVNLYTDDLGNPELPAKFSALAAQTVQRPGRTFPLSKIGIIALILTLVGLVISAVMFAPAIFRARQHTSAAATGLAISATARPAKSIAVLPFENLSGDKDNAYFASGMQDMILTKLAGIGDLKVISRTSTEKYASHPGNLKTIAQQLGVATILEGSVQKSGNQVLINVQLIDAATDGHLWADAYPRTLDNIFGVEGEVAQKVADAPKAKLTKAEQQNVTAIPTRNPQAWDAFLKAESLAFTAQDSEEDSGFQAADEAYRQAIALDPKFALAYAQRTVNQMCRHWYAHHLSASDLADVKASADKALALAPDLPQTYLALGYYYYWGFRNYSEAVPQFQHILQLEPNNIDALMALASIDRRTGQFEQALAAFGRAAPIAPRDRVLLTEYGITFQLLRRYPEADQQLSRALAVDPTYAIARDYLVRTRLFGLGDVHGARAALDQPLAWQIAHVNSLSGDALNLVNPRVYPDLFDRQFDAALHDWDSAPTDTDDERLTQRVARVAIQVIAGRQATIQSECTQLKSLLDAEVTNNSESLSALQQASWVDVCLGRNAEAIASAQHAADVLPLGKDAYFGVYQLEGLAEIEAHAGAPDDALKLIEQLLAMPAGQSMSIARLKLDPAWDPLRKDPRFQKLIAGGEAAMKLQAKP